MKRLDSIRGWFASPAGNTVRIAAHTLVFVGALWLVFIGVKSSEFRDPNPLSVLGLVAISWLSLASVLTIPVSWHTFDEKKSREAASELEAKAEKEETLVDYVEAQLIAAAARQEIAVSTAERRANRLASTGFLLMISSVLVPFGLVYLYMTLPPVGPPTASTAPQRDWHLLLAGVSFGLLFIAAARGILLAEGRQREVYGREVRETAYYGDLRRALGMAQRLDKKRNDAVETSTEEVVRTIMALMLERGGREPVATSAADLAPTGEHEFLKIVTDSIKK